MSPTLNTPQAQPIDGCLSFSTFDPASDPNFVALGATPNDLSPLIVFSRDPVRTKAFFEARDPQLKDRLSYVQSSGFATPRTLSLPGTAAAASLWQAFADSLATFGQSLTPTPPAEVYAGTPIVTGGTLGCSLRSSGGDAYFLTAGHLVTAPNQPVYIVDTSHQAGTVVEYSTVTGGSGLDWALVGASRGYLPSARLRWDPLSLGGLVPKAQLSALQNQTIAMSGGASGMRTTGTVVSAQACVALLDGPSPGQAQRIVRQNQIIVQSSPSGTPFGQPSDSGAVAYTLNNSGFADGTAIGIYWLRSLDGTQHVLAPLEDVLAEIGAARQDTFSLWT